MDTETRSELEPRRSRRAAGGDPVKRQQIIEGARRVFIDMGFDAASMNDITRAAGVSKGTIYVYFENKEELFEALIEEERCKIFNDLYDVLTSDEDLRVVLGRFGRRLIDKILSDKVIMAQRIVVGVADRIPELGARFYERGPLRGHEKVVEFLKLAAGRGLLAIDDFELAAYQLTELMMAGLFRQRLFGYRTEAPGAAEAAHVVEAGVDLFLRAYGTEAGRRGGKAAARPRARALL